MSFSPNTNYCSSRTSSHGALFWLQYNSVTHKHQSHVCALRIVVLAALAHFSTSFSLASAFPVFPGIRYSGNLDKNRNDQRHVIHSLSTQDMDIVLHVAKVAIKWRAGGNGSTATHEPVLGPHRGPRMYTYRSVDLQSDRQH